MSDKNKWVVFPEGTAGLYKVELKNGKSAMVLRTEVSEGGGKVRDEAVSFGFEAVPDHGEFLHFTPAGNDDFDIEELARKLNGQIVILDEDGMRDRTFSASSPAPQRREEPMIRPIRPVMIANNSMGEPVFSAENGRFIKLENSGQEMFIKEPETGSKARFLRANTKDDLSPIAGAIFKNINNSFSGAKLDNIIKFSMELRSGEEAPEFTFEEAKSFIRADLIKQVMESSVQNDASRGAWHDTARIATWMNSAVSVDTQKGEPLSPSLHLMMLVHRLTRKFNSVNFEGSEDLSMALPGRHEKDASLSVIDLSTVREGQRLSYAMHKAIQRSDEGRTIILMPNDVHGEEVEAIKQGLGTVYGVESVVGMPNVVADGATGVQDWTMMVFGDKRPEPLDALPQAALRVMKAQTPDELLSVEREINRSVDRLREFNSGEESEIAKAAENDENKPNDHQVPYIAMSRVSEPETMIPYALQAAFSTAQRKVMRHMEETGGVDATVSASMGVSIDEMGDFMSAEQVDSVAFWLYSRAKDMKGFACLDGTGVGKTRTNLGIAKAFLRLPDHEGKKRKIFYLTEKGLLNAPDIVKEMHEMGMGDLRIGVLTAPFKGETEVNNPPGSNKPTRIIPVNAMKKKEKEDILESGQMPDDYDVIISTFSTFSSSKDDAPATMWAQSAFGEETMIIADEAHNAINIKSSTGKNIKAMRDALPDNQFLSSTATPFKTPEEVMSYSYLLPKEAGDPEEIMQAVVRGREAAQEAFQTMLAQDGSIIRRTRNLSSVVFKAHLPDDEQLRYNQGVMTSFADLSIMMSEQNRLIKNRVRTLMEERRQQLLNQGIDAELANIRAGDQFSQSGDKFGTALSRITNMLTVSLRIQGILPQIRDDIKSGMKPVISFEHTLMQMFEDYETGENVGHLTMSDQLHRIMRNLYTVTINGQQEDIRDHDPEIRAMSENIRGALQRFPELPASPLDWLMDRLEDDGLTCGEMSGRTRRISHGTILSRTSAEKNTRAVVDKFNSGEIDVLFHNKTGATGVSFHAHKNFRDQRPRSTYIIAAFSEVIKMLQGFGRTDRKEQTSNPTINWVMTGLMSETRAFQQINKRLRMLGASVDANRNHPMLIADVPDLLNKVGDRAFFNVLRNRPEIAERLDLSHVIRLDENRFENDREDAISATSIIDLANSAMSKMVMLRDEEQNQLMNSVSLEFDALIEELDAKNANPLKPKMIAGEIEITAQVVYQGEEADDDNWDRSAFLDPLYLGTGIQRIEGKTFTGDDVMARVERCRRLQGADGLDTWADTIRQMMPNLLRRHLNDDMTYEQAVENPTAAGPIFAKRYDFMERLIRTMEQIKPGATIRMPMIDDLWDVPQSYVITDIIPPPNIVESGNAAGYKIKLVAPGELTERQVSLKRIMDLNDDEVFFHIGLSRGDNPELRKRFDDASSEVFERPVQVLNGNLLKGIVLSMNHGLGTPCLYRDAGTGQLTKGIVITDKKLDLNLLPVDIRDINVAKAMIDKTRSGNEKRTLIKFYGSPSNQKNEYSIKDAPFFMTSTKDTFNFSYSFNKGNYEFYADRPKLYEAIFGHELPEKKKVRLQRGNRMLRLSYSVPDQARRIETIIEESMRRIDSPDAINMNYYMGGSFRAEYNEILRIQNPQINVHDLSEEEPDDAVEVKESAESPVDSPEQKQESVIIKPDDEEEIQWEI